MADDKYVELKRYLASSEAQGLSASDVERELNERGRKLLRELMQAHVEIRGPGEAIVPVRDAEGVERTELRSHERDLETVFGTVEVLRVGYAREGLESLHPLDGDLNLPQERYSLEVRRRVAIEAARVSYDQTKDSLELSTGAKVPRRQMEQLVQRAAEDFDAFYERRHEKATPAAGEDSVLVFTVDAKGVVMHKQDLREATRQAAQKRRHKLSGRLTKGEKKYAKRMATVAAIYTVPPFVRTPEQFLRSLIGTESDDPKNKPPSRPRPVSKRVWASLKKPPEEVIEEALWEAESRDPDHVKRWTVVIDGAEHQLELLVEITSTYDVQVTFIVDIIHVAEYVWKASLAFHEEGSPDREIWVWTRLRLILDGKAVAVAKGMRCSATLQELSAAKREPVDTCADYLLKYAPYLRYDAYLADGLPIASGVIEGACRHLIRDRMELTGARWRLDGAEAILRLRALRASGDFDAYWPFHEDREYQRNHARFYANGQVPAVRSAPTPSAPARKTTRLKLVK